MCIVNRLSSLSLHRILYHFLGLLTEAAVVSLLIKLSKVVLIIDKPRLIGTVYKIQSSRVGYSKQAHISTNELRTPG